jgi:hypothetical protein
MQALAIVHRIIMRNRCLPELASHKPVTQTSRSMCALVW